MPRSTCSSIGGAGRPAPRSYARSATSPSRSDSDAAPMTATRTLVQPGPERLRAAGSSDTPRLDAELLLAHAIGVDRTAVIAHGDAPVGANAAAAYEALMRGREGGEGGAE